MRHQISYLGPGSDVHAVEGGVVPPSLLDAVAPSGGLQVDLETKFYFLVLSCFSWYVLLYPVQFKVYLSHKACTL